MDVLDVIGDFGRFQKETFFVISLRSVVLVFTFYVIHMSASNVEHWCAPVEPMRNLTEREWKECCVPKVRGTFSSCQRYEVDDSGVIQNDTIVDCYEHQFDKSHISSSLKTEFNLVCDRKYMMSILYAMFFSGNLVAYPVAGFFSDRFGRRTTCLIGLLGMTVFNTMMALSKSITMFMAGRFIGGCFYTFVQSPTITIFMEIAGKRQRALTSIFTGGVWGLANCLALIISSYLTDWRTFALIGSFPCTLPYLVLCWWLLPESPRWLLTMGKKEKAADVLSRAAKRNKIVIHDMDSVIKSLAQKIESKSSPEEVSSLKEFFKNKSLMKICALVLLSFMVNRFLANGFYVTLRNLSGNFRTNFAISSSLNVVASVVNSGVQATVTKRRWMLFCTFMFSGVPFIITTFLGQDLKWLRVAVAMMAKFSNKFTSSALMLYMTEVIPTRMRARGTTIMQTAGRVGALFSSFTDLLSQTYGPNSAYYLFGGLAIFTSLGYLFVPDMDNKNLPDSVAETVRNVVSKTETANADDLPEVAYSALPVA